MKRHMAVSISEFLYAVATHILTVAVKGMSMADRVVVNVAEALALCKEAQDRSLLRDNLLRRWHENGTDLVASLDEPDLRTATEEMWRTWAEGLANAGHASSIAGTTAAQIIRAIGRAGGETDEV